MTAIDAVLRRERAVLGGGLVLLTALAWACVWDGAGTGMSAWDMTAATLFPHRLPPVGGSMGTPLPLVAAMWWIMMVAMMTPSAAPLVLLYGTVLRHHAGQPVDAGAGVASATPPVYRATLLLLAGYLLAWLAFSLLATALQWALGPTGWLSPMMWWSRSAGASAVVLALAGTYQFTTLKSRCLHQCRSPVAFLMHHWRPGWRGSVGLGLRHGAYCVGCCWALMLLLFVGGVMNLLWIAALALLVGVEKLAPAGARAGRWTGAVLLLWAGATLLV